MNGRRLGVLDNKDVMALKAFNSAVYYERRQAWNKAIKRYEDLDAVLPCVQTMAHSKHVQLKILIFECLCLRGVAHQKLEEHLKAISCFTRAMKVLQQKKDDCCAGCLSGTFLHRLVPVLAKKTLSYLTLGQVDQALRDVESALVKDFSNRDLFCIRSLVNFTRGRKENALTDIKHVLKQDRTNLCALILRGYFTASPKHETRVPRELPADHIKACERNPDCYSFVQIEDIKTEFGVLFERFLPSLRVSHTVSLSEFFEEETFLDKGQSAFNKKKRSSDNTKLPFVCGTPVNRNRRASLPSDCCTRNGSVSRNIKSADQLMCQHCWLGESRYPCSSHVPSCFVPSSAPVQYQRTMHRRVSKELDECIQTDFDLSSCSQTSSASSAGRTEQNYPNLLLESKNRAWGNERERMYPKPWLYDKVPVPVPRIGSSSTRQVSQEVPLLPPFPSYVGQLRNARKPHR